MTGPFGVRRDTWATFAEARAAFDAMLDRVEAAQRDHTGYGIAEHAADVAIAEVFVEDWWAMLTNAEQTRYASRVAYLKAVGKGLR